MERGKKVLVFEDSPNIQILLKFFFQKRDFVVRIESDGTDAVALASDFKPDLILLDYNMPGKDGVETTLDLRHAGVSTPIVMLTSKTFASDRARAIAAGVNAYLTKPFSPLELESAVLTHLNA